MFVSLAASLSRVSLWNLSLQLPLERFEQLALHCNTAASWVWPSETTVTHAIDTCILHFHLYRSALNISTQAISAYQSAHHWRLSMDVFRSFSCIDFFSDMSESFGAFRPARWGACSECGVRPDESLGRLTWLNSFVHLISFHSFIPL